MDSHLDRQSEVENALFGTVIPSIRELAQLLTHQTENRTFLEAIAAVTDKLNVISQQHRIRSEQRIQYPAMNQHPNHSGNEQHR